MKDELIIDRLSAVQVLPAHDALKKEAIDLDAQIRQIQDSLETLVRIQQRSLESSLYNKANELQEDISMKRFDLRVAQMHLSAINSQVGYYFYILLGVKKNFKIYYVVIFISGILKVRLPSNYTFWGRVTWICIDA